MTGAIRSVLTSNTPPPPFNYESGHPNTDIARISPLSLAESSRYDARTLCVGPPAVSRLSRERRQQMSLLGRGGPCGPCECSCWFGWNGVLLHNGLPLDEAQETSVSPYCIVLTMTCKHGHAPEEGSTALCAAFLLDQPGGYADIILMAPGSFSVTAWHELGCDVRPSNSHTRTHTHIHTHTHRETGTRTQRHIHTHTHRETGTCTQRHIHTHTHRETGTCTQRHIHTHTHRQTQACTHRHVWSLIPPWACRSVPEQDT